MKNNQIQGGSTRRSFMKKSVVAAVAASSLTIFSGLVNADQEVYKADGVTTCTAMNTFCVQTQIEGGTSEWQCPCKDSNGKIKVSGTVCDDINGTNPKCK
jgi:hypothetical protein